MTDITLSTNQIWAILGPPGSGKSTVLRCLVAMYCRRDARSRYIILDTKSSLWRTGIDPVTQKKPAYTIDLADLGFEMIRVDPIGDMINDDHIPLSAMAEDPDFRKEAIEGWKDLIRQYERRGTNKLIFYFTGSGGGSVLPELGSQIAAAVEEMGFALLAIDEASAFIPAQAEGRGWGVQQASTRGRERAVDIIISSQFLAYTGKLMVRTANNKLVFHFDVMQDLNQLKGFITDVERIKALKKYEFIWRSEGEFEEIWNTSELYNETIIGYARPEFVTEEAVHA